MFREMRRKRQLLPAEDSIAILNKFFYVLGGTTEHIEPLQSLLQGRWACAMVPPSTFM